LVPSYAGRLYVTCEKLPAILKCKPVVLTRAVKSLLYAVCHLRKKFRNKFLYVFLDSLSIHILKTHWGMDVKLHAFVTLTPDRGEWSVSYSGCFTAEQTVLSTH